MISEWLELMLAEITRKKEEEAAALAAAKLEKEKAAALALAASKKKEEEKVAAAAVVTESDNDGCMSWLKWLIPLLLLLALLAYFLRGCDGCNTKPVVPPVVDPTPPPPVDTVETAPIPLGKNCSEMGMGAESICCAVADHLSNPNTKLPKEFSVTGVNFSRNSARLSSRSKKNLDDLVTCLKEYGNANLDVYGYITGSESGAY